MNKLELWRKRKKELKYTNFKIAYEAELPIRTVEQIMCGRVKTPRLDTVQAIDKALGIVDNISTDVEFVNLLQDENAVCKCDEEIEILKKYREVESVVGDKGKNLIIEFCDMLIDKFNLK